VVRWRARFAAPFVVIACPGDRAPSAPVAVETPRDRGAVETPRDAAVEDARMPSPPLVDCRPDAPPDPTAPACNPPAPPVLQGPVIEKQLEGNRVRIVVGRGAKHGIAKTWRAAFVTESGRAIEGHELTIIRVDRSTTRLVFAGTDLPTQTIRFTPR
jgi:hypothetical protein